MHRRLSHRGISIIGRSAATTAIALFAAAPVFALDLTVRSIQINQQIQLGGTTLIAGRPTMVRVTVGVGNQQSAGVDALLYVVVDGLLTPESPLNSLNGPITAVVSPNLQSENQTLNFFMPAPLGDDVDLIVELNPTGPGRLVETDYENNFGVAVDVSFECRRTPEIVYAQVDYRPNGGDTPLLPPADMITSNVGAAFVRAIWPLPDWNYHEWPMPPQLWTQNINNSSSQFVSNLSFIRTVTIPGLGYPTADYIFGWFPGNPFSGNGLANGIPGDAAFGNSQSVRHQRTFAHELGHLLGLPHTGNDINTVGVDVLHHLAEPLGLGRIKSPSLATIMVAGLQTDDAWIDSPEFEFVADRPLLQCNDALAPPVPVMHITGVYDNRAGALTLNPAFVVTPQRPTESAADPNLSVEVFGAMSTRTPMFRVAVNTNSAADRCDAPNERYETSPFGVLLPLAFGPTRAPVERVAVRNLATGNVIAELKRSATAPAAAFTAPAFGTNIDRPTRIAWTGADPDGDTLTYTLMYSHNGGRSWFVLGAYLQNADFTLDPATIAGSKPGQGRLRLLVSDGLNNSVAETGFLSFAGQTPPRAEILHPNNNDQFPALTPITFFGTNWDAEDLVIPDEFMTWTSNRDGQFATGRTFHFDRLSAGLHDVTLTVTDEDGLEASNSVSIQIAHRSTPQGDCNTNGTGDIDDILGATSLDCDGNRIPDECDIAGGLMDDVNDNGIGDQCEDIGDLDLDSDRDIADYAAFLDCRTGPAEPVSAGCTQADIDGDSDVDFADYGLFARLFSGECRATILSQPISMPSCANSAASFQVQAAGTGLRYQWFRNGEPVPGATSPQLTINPVSPANAGTYFAAVFNTCGAVRSNNATLTVAQPPVITQQPAGVVTCPGSPAQFSVSATGAPPLSYQWQRNTVNIPGAVQPTFTIAAAGLDDIAAYRCVVTDACPSSSTSFGAALSFHPEAVVTTHPEGGQWCSGEIVFLLTAGSGAISFQWFKDDELIPGATSAFFIIVNASTAHSGSYHCVVTGQCDSAASNDAVVTVAPCGANP